MEFTVVPGSLNIHDSLQPWFQALTGVSLTCEILSQAVGVHSLFPYLLLELKKRNNATEVIRTILQLGVELNVGELRFLLLHAYI